VEVIRIEFDFGDIVFSVTARVKNIVQPHKVVFRIGAPRKVSEAERNAPHTSPVTAHPTGKVDLYMDLKDDNKVALAIGWTDDAGNAADAPSGGFTASYDVDNPSLLALTDNGDGTAEVAATGALGTATVHLDVNWTDDTGAHNATGDLSITVVSDMASRVNITAGTPEHV
jgi:hypothetical protein